jgi:hypothetical protein
MKGLVLDYRQFSPFYYIRLISRVIYNWKMKNFQVIFCHFWPSSPCHLADKKQSILSKGKFLSLNCCFINFNKAINLQLFFNNQLNTNWTIQIQQCALRQIFDKMLCLLLLKCPDHPVSWPGGWRQKRTENGLKIVSFFNRK